jgi:hypothetical protein
MILFLLSATSFLPLIRLVAVHIGSSAKKRASRAKKNQAPSQCDGAWRVDIAVASVAEE